MIRKFLDWITGEDARLSREILKLKCDTKHVWHVSDNVPVEYRRYLVLCKVGNKYVRAIADAQFGFVDMGAEYKYKTIWAIDRFLTSGPVERNKRLKVVAWAELKTEEDNDNAE